MSMSGFQFNKYRIRNKFIYFKQQCSYWFYQTKVIAKQVFIPLAIFQLIRTILFPTPLDVILLLIIFAIVIFIVFEWL